MDRSNVLVPVQLYAWQFDEECHPVGPPAAVLKTHRSMRAIHFHPLCAPLMLSAEVNTKFSII